MAATQIDRNKPIPDTIVFDLEASRRGYRINSLCNTLITEENRRAYKEDELAYLARHDLTAAERQLILNRDWAGLCDAGGSIYYLLKLGFVVGEGLYRMGAQMRGESFDEFLNTRKGRGAR